MSWVKKSIPGLISVLIPMVKFSLEILLHCYPLFPQFRIGTIVSNHFCWKSLLILIGWSRYKVWLIPSIWYFIWYLKLLIMIISMIHCLCTWRLQLITISIQTAIHSFCWRHYTGSTTWIGIMVLSSCNRHMTAMTRCIKKTLSWATSGIQLLSTWKLRLRKGTGWSSSKFLSMLHWWVLFRSWFHEKCPSFFSATGSSRWWFYLS